MIRAVLFDLDDTLLPERLAWAKAFDGACRLDTTLAGVDLEDLRLRVFGASRKLWEESEVSAYCQRVGLGSPSSLLSSYPGRRAEDKFLKG